MSAFVPTVMLIFFSYEQNEVVNMTTLFTCYVAALACIRRSLRCVRATQHFTVERHLTAAVQHRPCPVNQRQVRTAGAVSPRADICLL